VVATAIPALMQSALPLDLVRGGLLRAAQPEAISALLIGGQLGLLVLIQWPVGAALARRSVAAGLGLSLVCFALGTLLLALSALSGARRAAGGGGTAAPLPGGGCIPAHLHRSGGGTEPTRTRRPGDGAVLAVLCT